MKNFTLKLTLLLALLFTASLGMAQTTYQTVGIIGSATAAGWNNSTAMTRVAGGTGHQWTITLPLTVGEVKFRADNDWAVNWGDTAFPAGTGTSGGANIPVATAGTYTVLFNDLTGGYQFSRITGTRSASLQSAVLNLSLAPNPAHGALSVSYDLPTAATATLSVYNLLGQPVRQLAAARQSAGEQAQALSLEGLAPGVYLVQLQAGSQAQTARLVVE